MDPVSIESVQVEDHPSGRKTFADEGLPLRGEASGEVRGIGQLAQAVHQGIEVIRLDQEAGLFIDADFRGSVAVICDNGSACRQRLRQDPGETLAAGEVDEDIHEGEVPGYICRRDQPGEQDAPVQRRLPGQSLEAFPPRTIAHQKDAQVRDPLQQLRGGPE